MAITSPRAVQNVQLSAWAFPAAAATRYRKGDACIITAGIPIPADGASASGSIFGFVDGEVDNSTGVAGEKTVVINFFKSIDAVWVPLATAGAPTTADIGKQVYLNAVSALITAATGNPVGKRLLAVDAFYGGLVEV
jgi:hypothetical protein